MTSFPKSCIDAHCAKFFLYNLGTGSSLPKQLSGPKLMGIWAKKALKNLGPPIYFRKCWS